MEWEPILAHYKRLFRESGRTQTQVAHAGGLKKPNLISKMLDNRGQGPYVETFVRAVIGLGLTPSEFFRSLEQSIEHGEAAELPIVPKPILRASRIHGPFTVEDAARVTKVIAALFEQLQLKAPTPRKRPRRR